MSRTETLQRIHEARIELEHAAHSLYTNARRFKGRHTGLARALKQFEDAQARLDEVRRGAER